MHTLYPKTVGSFSRNCGRTRLLRLKRPFCAISPTDPPSKGVTTAKLTHIYRTFANRYATERSPAHTCRVVSASHQCAAHPPVFSRPVQPPRPQRPRFARHLPEASVQLRVHRTRPYAATAARPAREACSPYGLSMPVRLSKPLRPYTTKAKSTMAPPGTAMVLADAEGDGNGLTAEL